MRRRTPFSFQPLPRDGGELLISSLETIFQSASDAFTGLDRDKATLVNPPASASSPGDAGQFSYDSDYIYICVSTDTWKRVGIATW